MLILSLLACGKPPDVAPETLDEMSSALLAGFESDDVAALAQPLADWLVEHVDETDGYSLVQLTEEQAAGMQPQPAATDLTAQDGIAVTHRVVGSVEQHVAVVPEADQTFADPSTYITWDRQLTEGTAQGFLGGEGLRTENQIDKSAGIFSIHIAYPMKKDYRWVDLEQGRTAVFRSWSTESGCAEDGVNCLQSGFTVEIWVPDDAGLIWYNASWCDLDTSVDGIIDPDYERQTIIDGTIDYMDGTAAHATGADQE